MIIFDGYAFAQRKEQSLLYQVQLLAEQGVELKLAAILFTEDAGSQLYTRLKKDAAQRVGIGYEIFSFSMTDPVEEILSTLSKLNADTSITGIIIQKPSKKRWMEVLDAGTEEFVQWWHQLVEEIEPTKDVDGLHPSTLLAVEHGTWKQDRKVLPATAKAVLSILEQAKKIAEEPWTLKKYIVIGKSDILGKPLFYELKNQGFDVEMIGSKELQLRRETGQKLLDADVIISATGVSKMVTGEMVKQGVVLIDVGEPQPDADFESVSGKSAFITPVPGGVGPVTVVSLLENAVELKN
jgi:methylenetetrahydrofolate dehydrogenase (NADP+) / methenyltetrahydrofolate cyclohydrolase